MVAPTLKELAAAKAKMAKLQQTVARELPRELAALPGRYGFNNTAAFIAAVKAASGGRRAAKPKDFGKRKFRKRAKITDATRAKVKKLVESGKTGGAIARKLAISLPSVQNIKKALGLTRGSGPKPK